jgi:hypothetical protein
MRRGRRVERKEQKSLASIKRCQAFLFSQMHTEKINENSRQYFRLLFIGLTAVLMLGRAGVISSSAGLNKEKIISVSFSTIEKGFRSGIKERKFVVIKTEKEWEEFWRLHKKTFLPEQQIPPVDFKQEMVIAVFSGEKRTGGYGIEITRVEENLGKSQLEVFFLETHPSPKSMVTQDLTQPCHIVNLKKVDVPLVFIPGSHTTPGKAGGLIKP